MSSSSATKQLFSVNLESTRDMIQRVGALDRPRQASNDITIKEKERLATPASHSSFTISALQSFNRTGPAGCKSFEGGVIAELPAILQPALFPPTVRSKFLEGKSEKVDVDEVPKSVNRKK
jgi:hypothetical protein